MHLADDGYYDLPKEDAEFCEHIVSRIPKLKGLWEEHLREELNDPAPYIFFFTLAQWAEEHAVSDPESVTQLLSLLNGGLESGVGDVPNLVLAGFVESMSGGTPLIPLVTGALKPWVEYQFGDRGVPPMP